MVPFASDHADGPYFVTRDSGPDGSLKPRRHTRFDGRTWCVDGDGSNGVALSRLSASGLSSYA